MKLKIRDAIDKGDKFILKMEYDQEFADIIANVCGIEYADRKQIEAFVAMVLENMDVDDLRELGDQINE